MKICFIGCGFKYDIYSHQLNNILSAFREIPGTRVKFVTSNCSCFSSTNTYGIAEQELLDKDCCAVKLPYIPVDPSKRHGLLKFYLVKGLRLNHFMEPLRGLFFFLRSFDCSAIYFDQVLRSFGILSLSSLLCFASVFRRKVLVAVHELDPLQEKWRFLNTMYNMADVVLVFSHDMKDRLVHLGVQTGRIEVVPFSVRLPKMNDCERDRYIFFGGHKLLRGKGFDTLLDALKIVSDRGVTPKVQIYVGEGCYGLEEGKREVSERGLDKFIEWCPFLCNEALSSAFQRSIACLIPYTGGSGRYAATNAMANATPVIATPRAELPEYLGDLGIYIDENSPEQLAESMIRLYRDGTMVSKLGAELRKRAEKYCAAHVVATETMRICERIS